MPVTIRPSDIMRTPYYVEPAAFLLYEEFVRRAADWMRREKRPCWEIINDSSSIHNSSTGEFVKASSVLGFLCSLFNDVGRDTDRGRFLSHCKIRKWADLDKPFTFRCRLPHVFASSDWFDVQRRKTLVSHNDLHPDAIWACRATLQFCNHNLRWAYRIYYSYEHEDSSWNVPCYQRRGESISGFAKRVEAFIEETLGPEECGEDVG